MSDHELELAYGLRYFTADEINAVSFGCVDGFNKIQSIAIIKLDEVRHRLGYPLTLTCAYRTREHDISKGRSGNSDHCLGTGFDIQINGLVHALQIVAESAKEGFNSFGINLKAGFVHIGIKPKTKITTWEY